MASDEKYEVISNYNQTHILPLQQKNIPVKILMIME